VGGDGAGGVMLTENKPVLRLDCFFLIEVR